MRALVISNLHAPDCTGGYEMVASECLDALERDHGWQITCHCARTGRPAPFAPNNRKSKIENRKSSYPSRVHPDLTGYFPRGWTHHHALLPAARHLARTPQIVETLTRESREAGATLLFNPRRLSTLQWLPAMAAARNPVAWVSDYWPIEYPDCDKLWQAAQANRLSWSPLVMLGAARVRKQYATGRKLASDDDAGNTELAECRWRSEPLGGRREAPPQSAKKNLGAPSHPDLACIKRAAFVSEHIMRKTAHAFPSLEEAIVIHNGIDPALFPYAPMTPDRWRTWGFCGRIQPEKGVLQALDLFARAAATRPGLRFLIAGDMTTSHGAEVRQKIATTPILACRVDCLGPIPRERLAEKFYHRAGVLLFTSQWDEPYALTLLEAMSTGTHVVATPTGGTPEIITPETGTLLPTALPSENFNLNFQLKLQLANARAFAAQRTIARMAERIADFACRQNRLR